MYSFVWGCYDDGILRHSWLRNFLHYVFLNFSYAQTFYLTLFSDVIIVRSPGMRDHISHAHKTTGKIKVFIF